MCHIKSAVEFFIEAEPVPLTIHIAIFNQMEALKRLTFSESIKLYDERRTLRF